MADDASTKVPYLQAYGNIKRALDKITTAAVPPRFTQDFLATTLNLPGGGARPVIPYLKRAGFLTADGTPTDLYKQFRNQSMRGAAGARAVRNAYGSLYAANEYVHDASEKDLKGLIVQVTGLEGTSKLIPAMLGSFKTLKEYADFNASADSRIDHQVDDESDGLSGTHSPQGQNDEHYNSIRLGYTIHLNLPATTDIAVFNAIFKSLKEHLL